MTQSWGPVNPKWEEYWEATKAQREIQKRLSEQGYRPGQKEEKGERHTGVRQQPAEHRVDPS